MRGIESAVLIWRARDEGGPSAQEMLNKWLEQNADKDIVNVSQSESGDTIASRRITYTIFYRKG